MEKEMITLRNQKLILTALASLLAACALALFIPSRLIYQPLYDMAQTLDVQVTETWTTFRAVLASFRLRLFLLAPILMAVFWRICLPLIDLPLTRINRWLMVFLFLFLAIIGLYVTTLFPALMTYFASFYLSKSENIITWELSGLMDLIRSGLTLLAIPVFIAQHLIAVKYKWVAPQLSLTQWAVVLVGIWLSVLLISPPDITSTLLIGAGLTVAALIDGLLAGILGKSVQTNSGNSFPSYFTPLWLLPWLLFWLTGAL